VSVRRWDLIRKFALSLPAAAEDCPWGETVVKARTKPGVPSWRKDGQGVLGPMFLWLGQRDAAAHAVAVKLTTSYEAAMALANASPTTISGLGQWGWLTIALADVDTDLACDWVDESYRAVAPKRLVRALDEGVPRSPARRR
jgi:predicted DNA-binding protein (MmcQ/YjbR family)